MTNSWGEKLKDCFPGWDGESVPGWQELVADLAIGQAIDGKVVAVAPFGVWIDVGIRVPALLLVVDFADSDSRSYELSDYPAVGDQVSGWVRALTPKGQIAITQLSCRLVK